MKQTWRSWARSRRRSALAAALGVAREGALAAVVLAGRQALDQRLDARGGVVARAELVDVDAGRPEPGARGQARRRPSPPTATRRCGASRRARRARLRQALARPGQEARGVALDDVLQRAAVHLDRVGDVAAEPAGDDRGAHDEVVGERHVGPRAGADVAHGGHVGLRRRPRPRRRCTRAACAPRSPRSGRPRRRAAGARCRAARPSRAPARAAVAPAARRPPTCRPRRRSRAPRAAAPGRAGRRCARRGASAAHSRAL